MKLSKDDLMYTAECQYLIVLYHTCLTYNGFVSVSRNYPSFILLWCSPSCPKVYRAIFGTWQKKWKQNDAHILSTACNIHSEEG